MEDAFIRCFNLIFLGVAGRPFEENRDLLLRLEMFFIQISSHDEDLKLEFRRRIAEGLLMAAEMTGRSVAECEAQFEALSVLGFSSLVSKSGVVVSLARHMIDEDEPGRASRLLVPIIAELEGAIEKSRAENLRQALTTIRAIASEAERADVK